MSQRAPLGEGPHRRRDERLVSVAFLVTAGAGVGLAIVYWQGGQPQAEGALLATGAAGLAVGMITWAHRMMPSGPEEEEREVYADPDPTRRRFESDIDRGDLTRRRLILRSLGAAAVAFGAAFLFPLRSLGPRPSEEELDSTPWAPGVRLVTADGTPVKEADVPTGGLVTVFPDGHTSSETGQAVLVRVEENLIRDSPGRSGWSPGGLIAYSKVCTHAGCPVGLYEAASHQLLCPCHQSTFDVLDRARPIFGPAAEPLPQLPLRIDSDGTIRAGGGFSDPPGPSFWNRSR